MSGTSSTLVRTSSTQAQAPATSATTRSVTTSAPTNGGASTSSVTGRGTDTPATAATGSSSSPIGNSGSSTAARLQAYTAQVNANNNNNNNHNRGASPKSSPSPAPSSTSSASSSASSSRVPPSNTINNTTAVTKQGSSEKSRPVAIRANSNGIGDSATSSPTSPISPTSPTVVEGDVDIYPAMTLPGSFYRPSKLIVNPSNTTSTSSSQDAADARARAQLAIPLPRAPSTPLSDTNSNNSNTVTPSSSPPSTPSTPSPRPSHSNSNSVTNATAKPILIASLGLPSSAAVSAAAMAAVTPSSVGSVSPSPSPRTSGISVASGSVASGSHTSDSGSETKNGSYPSSDHIISASLITITSPPMPIQRQASYASVPPASSSLAYICPYPGRRVPYQLTRVITIAGGGSEGFADGVTTNAMFNGPEGIAIDGQGNVYIADHFNHSIRRISTDGVTSTIAGNGQEGYQDGIANMALFREPSGVAVNYDGTIIYVADRANHRFARAISFASSPPHTFIYIDGNC
jgi:hypothetical protein